MDISDIKIGARHRKDMGDIADLAANIKAIGLLHPVVISKSNELIAGARRIDAYLSLGRKTIPYRVVDMDAIILGELAENDVRKDFTVSERVAIGAAVEVQIGNRQGQRTDVELPQDFAEVKGKETGELAAEKFGFGNRETYRQAKAIVDNGAPELIEAVDAGKISIYAGEAISTLPVPEQIILVSGKADDVTEKTKEIKQARKKASGAKRAAAKLIVPDGLPLITERYSLVHSDLRYAEIAPGSIDCIVTDPPYPHEFIDVFGYLASAASLWLKPGGSMMVMSGQSWLPEVLAKLTSTDLTYQWTLAYLTPGDGASIFDRHVNTSWKPVFWLVKGKYKGDWIGDVPRSDGNDKRFHHWGQSESGMAGLIDRASMPGDTILDPFCGGGATGVAALKMNRLFIGIDIDETAIKTTAARLSGVAAEEAVAA
jgi:ParB-like chromosome segregation protein Spo0J